MCVYVLTNVVIKMRIMAMRNNFINRNSLLVTRFEVPVIFAQHSCPQGRQWQIEYIALKQNITTQNKHETIKYKFRRYFSNGIDYLLMQWAADRIHELSMSTPPHQ